MGESQSVERHIPDIAFPFRIARQPHEFFQHRGIHLGRGRSFVLQGKIAENSRRAVQIPLPRRIEGFPNIIHEIRCPLVPMADQCLHRLPRQNNGAGERVRFHQGDPAFDPEVMGNKFDVGEVLPICHIPFGAGATIRFPGTLPFVLPATHRMLKILRKRVKEPLLREARAFRPASVHPQLSKLPLPGFDFGKQDLPHAPSVLLHHPPAGDAAPA